MQHHTQHFQLSVVGSIKRCCSEIESSTQKIHVCIIENQRAFQNTRLLANILMQNHIVLELGCDAASQIACLADAARATPRGIQMLIPLVLRAADLFTLAGRVFA